MQNIQVTVKYDYRLLFVDEFIIRMNCGGSMSESGNVSKKS